jgi:GTP-binding protein Era
MPDFRTGFAAIVGRPNVGKSTLVNAFMGQKVAAVGPRPQTTRRRQLGILTTDEAQVIFVDTPGVHKPLHRLGEFMNDEAQLALADADVIVFLVDASQPPEPEDRLVVDRLAALESSPLATSPAVILALNKIDLVQPALLPVRQAAYQALVPQAVVLQISAATVYNCDRLLEEITRRLPAGSPFYSPDQVTDRYEREIAADLLREAALLHLREEVPHGIAVRVDEFTERGETGAYIAATIFVERESQKGIVIGEGGGMLKKIGSTARQEIEQMSGRKVYLELRVKVYKNWRNNPEALRLLGYVQEKEG